VASNAVYTVTIVDAILSIAMGKQEPGEFDLTNFPQWTWLQIYDFESKACKVAFAPRIVPSSPAQPIPRQIASRLGRNIRRWAKTPLFTRILNQLLAVAPPYLNARAQAEWYRLRASAEITALTAPPTLAEELSWVRLDRRILKSLQPTDRLLESDDYKFVGVNERGRWPQDLDLFTDTHVRPFEQSSAG
jgi:hypothetical protein